MNRNGRERDPVAPVYVDLEKPSAARVYDYLLGGNSHWAVDREFAERAIRCFPLVKPLAVANRRWLGRVVNAALDAGITQFLDLGSGLPSPGSVYEIVGRRTDQGRVVCVDSEPIAYAQWELRLGEVPGGFQWVTALREDVRDPEAILEDAETQELMDFTRPVCVLMVALLHFVGGETDVLEVIGQYRRAVASGSWLAISHIGNDAVPDPAEAAQVTDLVESYKETQTPAFLRDGAEIASWFTEWGELLDPGVVHLPAWRPGDLEHDLEASRVGPFSWCGAAVKPGNSEAA